MSIKDNFSNYLEKSIDSILSQSYTDFEFVIIADGSNDKTLDILKYYEKNDKRVKLIINKKNIGLAKRLNKGIYFANSEYIVWQDYDVNNTYNIDDWQRVEEFEELKDKIIQLRDEDFFEDKLEECRTNYERVLLTEDKYFQQFSDMMNKSTVL